MSILENISKGICIFLVFVTVPLLSKETFIPDPPSLNAQNYFLIDATTGKVLAENNSTGRIEPASLTKIMTGYVVADQIKEGFVNFEDKVFISENCWRKGGSKMYIREGTYVSLADLIKGMVIQSGNDASCSIAEHIAGSEENFVQLMMKYTNQLGMTETNFTNPHGWPEEDHFSTAKDLAILTINLISNFPEHYSLYKEKWFTFNDIRQKNRNTLLWQDEAVDGVKTGRTESAGFCLIASAKMEDTRLISITLNSSSEKTRLTDSRRLLDYGFRYYKTKKILSEGEYLKDEEVWGGQIDRVKISSSTDVYLTLPSNDFKDLDVLVALDDYLVAPIQKGQKVGNVLLKRGDNILSRTSVESSEEVEGQGFVGKAWTNIKLLVYKFLMEEDL